MGADEARALGEAICRRVAVMALPLADDSAIERITVSIVVAILDGRRCNDMESWLRAADHALHEAKDAGRSGVVVAH